MDINEAQTAAREIDRKLAAMGIEPVRESEGKSLGHARFMANQIADGMSLNKTMRWLGYLQAMLVFNGVSALDEEKDRNRRLVHGATD